MFNLTVHNYRSFQNQNFNFSRINILIGENSGGKSSILKLLLALKQTLDSPTEVNLKLTGDFTDLGNFEEVVYYKNKNKKIAIGFETSEKYFDYFLIFLNPLLKDFPKSKINIVKKFLNEYKTSNTKISFVFSSKLNDHSTIKTVFKNDFIGTLEIVQKKGRDENNTRQLLCDLKFSFLEQSGLIENCTSFKEGFFTLVDAEFQDKCKKQFGNKAEYVFYSIAFLLVFQNYLQEQIDKIRFVNPIGTSPKRFYFQEDRKASYKLIDIEKFINVLSDRTLTEKQYNERIELLNKTIKAFGIAEEVSIIRDKQLPVIALNVKTKDFWSNITDVGYGVSLQIPILFQALLSENYTKNGQTILIEQPEVHLHPTLQAKFIETLLSIGSKNTYFIETHSEHIIRKLQVLVKNKEFNIKPEDISIHYFKREPLKFKISEHKILDDGRLMPSFPAGFYDTSYSLVKELL
jgi:predicted ATPase